MTYLRFGIRDLPCLMPIVGILACVEAGCTPTNPPVVTFVLPSGFQGPFVVVEARTGAAADFKSGDATLLVPKSGVAVVDSATFLQEMSVWKARFSGGQTLRTETDGEYPDNTVMLRGGRYTATSDLGYTSRQYEFFVGTQDDFEAFDFDAWLKERPDAVDRP